MAEQHVSQLMPTAATRLTAEQKRHWDENGFVIIRNVFTQEEAELLRHEAHGIVQRTKDNGKGAYLGSLTRGGWPSAEQVAEGPRALLCVHNVQFHSAFFSRAICDPRLVDRAADLIGPNVQLHHTKM